MKKITLGQIIFFSHLENCLHHNPNLLNFQIQLYMYLHVYKIKMVLIYSRPTVCKSSTISSYTLHSFTECTSAMTFCICHKVENNWWRLLHVIYTPCHVFIAVFLLKITTIKHQKCNTEKTLIKCFMGHHAGFIRKLSLRYLHKQ